MEPDSEDVRGTTAIPAAIIKTWEAHDMTSLAEAERNFGPVVRDAGGTIFGIEPAFGAGCRQAEKLQIGTPDGFVKITVLLDQPYIDAVLREQTAILIRHAAELRSPACRALTGSSMADRRPVPRR